MTVKINRITTGTICILWEAEVYHKLYGHVVYTIKTEKFRFEPFDNYYGRDELGYKHKAIQLALEEITNDAIEKELLS